MHISCIWKRRVLCGILQLVHLRQLWYCIERGVTQQDYGRLLHLQKAQRATRQCMPFCVETLGAVWNLTVRSSSTAVVLSRMGCDQSTPRSLAAPAESAARHYTIQLCMETLRVCCGILQKYSRRLLWYFSQTGSISVMACIYSTKWVSYR